MNIFVSKNTVNKAIPSQGIALFFSTRRCSSDFLQTAGGLDK
jgi:hypothetical protein